RLITDRCPKNKGPDPSKDRALSHSRYRRMLYAAHEVGDFVRIHSATHDRGHRHVRGLLASETGLDFVHDQLDRHRLTTIHARAADDLRLGVTIDRSCHFLRQPSDVVKFWDHDELHVATERPQFLGGEGAQRADLDQSDVQTLVLAEANRFA